MVASWLSATVTAAALGVAVGLLLLAVMHWRAWHWSWAALALLALVASGTTLAGATLTLAVAAATAALVGRRRDREALLLGGADAVAATAIATPATIALGMLVAARRRLMPERAPPPTPDGSLVLGRDERGRSVAIAFSGGSTLGRHTLVLGATGSGKTVTQGVLVGAAIARGSAAVVVDPKGDAGLRRELVRAAHDAGRELLSWSPVGPCVYDPYAHGEETELADRALAGERFTEPHYQRQAQRYIGHALRAMRAAGRPTSLPELVAHMDPERLEELARTLHDDAGASCRAYLDSLSARQRAELGGVRDRLAILAESDVARWLDPATAAPRIDLLAAVRARAIVVFSLDADRRPLLAEMLGAAIVQDMVGVVAELQRRPVATVLVIDEFSALAAAQVVRLFGRARSAGVSLVLGTQELADLRPAGAGHLFERIAGNVSLLVSHRQAVPASAEAVAAMAGRRGAWRLARHSDGRSTRTRVREPVLEPERIMGLGRGCAALLELDGGPAVRIVRISAPAGAERARAIAAA